MRHLLVLAGTGEARQMLAWLVTEQRFRITASLAGVTSAPRALGVATRSGGFGGVDGLADWVRQHNVDIMLDMLTVVMVGSSSSRLLDLGRGKTIYTPRGYANKNNTIKDESKPK
mgnify:CR=1 FL=1